MPPGEHRLPDSLRERLSKPLGQLFKADETLSKKLRSTLDEAGLVITVGDRVTETVAQLGRIPDLQIVDGRERRMQRELPNVSHKVSIKTENPPGSITDAAIGAIIEGFRKNAGPVRILVEGEEDLMAIPAVAAAPIGSRLYYGQPLEGVVLVRVDEKAKARNRAILREMGISDL